MNVFRNSWYYIQSVQVIFRRAFFIKNSIKRIFIRKLVLMVWNVNFGREIQIFETF